MEGGVVLPGGLFFSGLFRGAAPLRPGQAATRSAPRLLAPCPCHSVYSHKSQKSLPATNMTGHSEAGMPLGPVVGCRPALMWNATFLCSIITLNESRASVVDLFVSRNSTICSRVAVRFTSLLLHMESRLARAFVGGSVWAAHHWILYSS